MSWNESNLKFMHRGDSGWENITTPLDTFNNIICGETTSFSEFNAGEPYPGDAYYSWVRGAGCFEIHFDATNNNGATYEWDFGDGNTASGEITSHSFPSAGTYITTLTVDGTNQRAIDIPISGNSSQVGKPSRISYNIPIPHASYFLTLQEAYDNAVEGDTLQSKDTTISGNINFSSDINIFFEGGYDCAYDSIVGTTTINGDILISNGTFTIQSGILAVL